MICTHLLSSRRQPTLFPITRKRFWLFLKLHCFQIRAHNQSRRRDLLHVFSRQSRRDLLQDDFNHVVLVRGGEHLTRSLVYVDHTLVDGVVNGTAASVGGLSGRLRKLQNGYARSYAVSMFGGAAILVAATLLMRAV